MKQFFGYLLEILLLVLAIFIGATIAFSLYFLVFVTIPSMVIGTAIWIIWNYFLVPQLLLGAMSYKAAISITMLLVVIRNLFNPSSVQSSYERIKNTVEEYMNK